ncbi:MAG: biotin/lipoyl-binding protein, partial [Chitinophagaceae bacterium]|nr:biotin/lipoyl-binding protein [Chitinophagaceae bacterium]
MRLFFFAVAVCSLSLVSCGGKKDKIQAPKNGGGAAKAPPPSKVDGYIVRLEAFQSTIEMPGSIVANEVTEIHPEVSGRIVQLNLVEGRYVGKGAVLAKLYDGDLQA